MPLTLTPQPTFQTQIGLGKEALGAWGTAVATSAYFPCEKPKFEDVPKLLYDKGNRGKRARIYTIQQGVLRSTFELPDMKFYPDDSGHFLAGILGAEAISGAGPYTHTLTEADALPNSYTLTDFSALTSGGQARQYTGGYLEEVALKYTADGDLLISAKGNAKPSTPVAKPAAAYSAAAFYEGYQAQLTLAGQVNARIMGMTFTIKQKNEVIFGSNNQQGPTAINVAGIEITGQMDVEPFDETEWTYMQGGTPQTASLLFTSGTNTLTLQATKMTFTKAPLDRSGDYVKIPMTFETAWNSTDAGVFKAVLVNGRSTVYVP